MGSSLESQSRPTSAQCRFELSLRWPAAPLRESLEEVGLLELWLERQLDRHVLELWRQHHGATQPVGALHHDCFGEEASSLFLQRRASLDEVLISLLQLDDSQLAQELWFRLQAGEAEFHQLSHHAIGPERHRGGLLGPIALQDLNSSLHALLKRLQPGELAAPLKTADGTVLLLRLEQRWPAQLDGHTRALLEEELYNRWRSAQLQPLLLQPPAPGSVVALRPPWH